MPRDCRQRRSVRQTSGETGGKPTTETSDSARGGVQKRQSSATSLILFPDLGPK